MGGQGTNGGARGRRATVGQAKIDVTDDNLTLVAAGVAFFALLALFPALIGVVAVYALVADSGQVADQLAPLLRALPSDAGSLLLRQLQTIVDASDDNLTVGLVILATLLAAAAVIVVLTRGRLGFDHRARPVLAST